MANMFKKIFGKEEDKSDNTQPLTSEEKNLLAEIITNQDNAESVRGENYNDTETRVIERGIDQIWEDEYKMFIGDQWDTSFAYRSKEDKKVRPNSVDNFIFPAIMNIHDTICSSVPEVVIEAQEESLEDGDDDKKVAEKLTHIIKFNDKRNKFRETWKKMVLQFLSYGPIIGGALWDNDWIGGKGPNRWIGDVRVININRKEIYFDPAIIDLEDRLQECSFIHRKFRKKVQYVQDKWPDKAQYISEEVNEDDLQDEGADPKQVYLIESWHRGKPKFVPEEYKKKYLEDAEIAEVMENDPYKAQELRDMAEGNLEGIHCAYVASGVLLEYKPYVYDDGMYPFVYKVLYYDENQPYGFGEIRNIKVPQVMHNKADEIEIEAMSREGLGGMYYTKGAINSRQKTEIIRNSAKGGMWFEVDNVNGLKEREGVTVPSSVREYKEHKQRMVETISQNTPIQQGMAPGANMPYKAIAELGARTDIRTKGKVEILEDFLIELNQLRINRIAQFYTEDRYYRIKGADDKVIDGTFNRNEMIKEWNRDEIRDEEGNLTGYKKEKYVPEFDLTVKIMDEKPTDRNYYTSTAVALFGQRAMDIESLWYTLDEGKFPQKDEILERLQNQDMAMQIANTANKLPPELQQAFFNGQQQLLQNIVMATQMQQGGESMGPR